MRACFIAVGLLVHMAVASRAAADQVLQPGATLTAFTIEDQHEQPHRIDESVRVIVFAADMDAGDVAKEALAQDGAQVLTQANGVYVANISGMPVLIAKMFALPAMRRRGYPVLLDRNGEMTRQFPRSEGKLTIIELDHLRVRGVRQIDTAADLRAVLTAARAPATSGGDEHRSAP